jgi:hypothetical protein
MKHHKGLWTLMGQDLIADFCEYNNELLNFIQVQNFDQLSNYQLFKEDPYYGVKS